MALLDGAGWISREYVLGSYVPSGEYYTDGIVEMANAGLQFPVVGWSASRAGTYEQVYCLSIPTASGLGTGVQMATPTDTFLPHFAIDGNGDVWIAWYTDSFEGMYFSHSYVGAIPSKPAISGSAQSRTIRWTISEPAPGSRWAVLRSTGGGFVDLGHVEAGDGVSLLFIDNSPALPLSRYKVRRECVDKRFVLDGPEQYWLQQKQRIEARVVGRLPVSNEVAVALDDAVRSPIDVRMFDVMGREVWRTRWDFVYGSEIRLKLDHAPRPIGSGLYYVVLRPESGEMVQPVRIVVVR